MIYFIQSGDCGPIKIGKAKHPESRLRELQTGSCEPLTLLATLDVDDNAEHSLHATLSGCRLRGEWFDSKELYVNVALACALAGHLFEYVCHSCINK